MPTIHLVTVDNMRSITSQNLDEPVMFHSPGLCCHAVPEPERTAGTSASGTRCVPFDQVE